jgi:hypothetical protein
LQEGGKRVYTDREKGLSSGYGDLENPEFGGGDRLTATAPSEDQA